MHTYIYTKMILLKSLIIFLFLLIIAHFIKKVSGQKKKTDIEGFANVDVDEINSYYDSNIASDLESENMPHQMIVQNTVQLPPELGGELAPSIGPGKMPASQKVQLQAQIEQTAEEEKTVGKHKKASDKALDMNYLKAQMDELVKLSNEAQMIKEDFQNND